MAYHEDIIIDEKGKTKCELCKVVLDDNDYDIEDHLNDKDHTKFTMLRLTTQNSIINTGNTLTCAVCEQEVDRTALMNHLLVPRHKDALQAVRDLVTKDGGFLILPDTLTEYGSTVYCLACDCTTDFNLKALKKHISSVTHKQTRAIAVQPLNAIFSVKDSHKDLWCKICQVFFQNYVELIFEHVDEDPKHVKEMEKLLMLIKDHEISIERYFQDPAEDKAFCKKCQVEVSCNLDNLERHINGKKHKHST